MRPELRLPLFLFLFFLLASLSYDSFVPLLVKAIQEQQALIDAQNQQIEAMNARIEALESRISE